MLARVLLYNDLFDDEIPVISKLLNEIPSNIIIRVLSHINSQLYIDNSLKNQNEIFGYLINRIDEVEKKRIIDRYNSLLNRKDDLIAFPVYSNLKLIESEILNYRIIDKTETTGEDELNILKAIIISNEIYDSDRLSKTRVDPKPDFIQLLWIIGFEQIEHSKNGLTGLMPSLFYADKLFEYLKNDNPEHYRNFLTNFNIDNHLDYLRNYLQLIQNGIKLKEKKVYSLFNFNLLEKHPFLRNFCIDIENFNSEEYIHNNKNVDFIGLREKPIIKHNETEYTVTNWNFILNKFLMGLMFDYYHSIYPERGNKAFFKFKNSLGDDFVEKSLLKNLLSEIFTPNGTEIDFLSDDKSKGYNFDFYIRIDNKIFLIECKDYLMPVKAKRGDIKETEAYLTDRMVGAVIQLHKQIKKLNNEDYSSINIPFDKNRLFIYPIIVHTDKSFSMPGINRYLKINLQRLLNENPTKFFHIWDLNLIHIDFFIQYQGVLKNNPKMLISLLNDSHHRKQALITQFKITKSSNDIVKAERNFEDLILDKLVQIDDNKLIELVTGLLS